MLTKDSKQHDPYLHQTIARNMTDSELAHRISVDPDAAPEYKAEANRRFAGLGIASLVPDPAREDLEDALQEESIRGAHEELCSELEDGREFL